MSLDLPGADLGIPELPGLDFESIGGAGGLEATSGINGDDTFTTGASFQAASSVSVVAVAMVAMLALVFLNR